MNISDLITKDTTKLTTWLSFRDGISFQIRYIPRAELIRMSKECLTYDYDQKRKERVQVVSREEFSKRFCASAVVGWKGLTPTSLAQLLPIDLTNMDAKQRVAEIEFNQANLLAIFNGAYEVDDFLQNSAVDVTLFKPFHAEELGNLPASQSGN